MENGKENRAERGKHMKLRTMTSLFAAIAASVVAIASPAQAVGFKVLHTFAGGYDGAYPDGALVVDRGNILGMTPFGGRVNLGTAFSFRLSDDRYRIIHEFGSSPTDGARPIAGLVVASNGYLYGTTALGGHYNFGTAFEMTDGGGFRVLHNFDRAYPKSPLVADSAGNLYGTLFDTLSGIHTLIYKLEKGKLSTAWVFDTAGAIDPIGGLALDKAGNLVGVTRYGGARELGTIFSLSPDRGAHPRTLLSFSYADGAFPVARPVVDAQGDVYGTAELGGVAKGHGPVRGVAYKVAAGGEFSVVRTFEGGSDGESPVGGLVVGGKDGFLYGTTKYGGLHNCGTVYKLKPFVSYEVLYAFTCGEDGAYPAAALAVEFGQIKTVLYGTTVAGGADGKGVMFRIEP
jgi:uncharacterized repeat protein (TIGR03803 family)